MNGFMDIDRALEQQEQENRIPVTFFEMVCYLKSQNNCQIHGKGYFIQDLHAFLLLNESIVIGTPEQNRKRNKNCIAIKKTIQKVMQDYLNGNTKPLDHQITHSRFNNYQIREK